MHSHRVGEPHVVAVSGESVTECQIPDITLPFKKDPRERWVQDWMEPVRWLPHSILLLSDSGLIQLQRINGYEIRYRYDSQIEFGQDGKALLKSVEQRESVKD